MLSREDYEKWTDRLWQGNKGLNEEARVCLASHDQAQRDHIKGLELLASQCLTVFTHLDYKGQRHYGGCDRNCVCEKNRVVIEPLMAILTEETP